MTEEKRPGGAADAYPAHDLPARTGLDTQQDRRTPYLRKLALASVRRKMAPLFRQLPPPEQDCDQSRAQREFYTRVLTDRIKAATVSPPAMGNLRPLYVAMLWFDGDAGFTPRWLTMPLADVIALLNAHAVAFEQFTVEPGAPWTAEAGQ